MVPAAEAVSFSRIYYEGHSPGTIFPLACRNLEGGFVELSSFYCQGLDYANLDGLAAISREHA